MLEVSEGDVKIVAGDFFDVNLTLIPTVSLRSCYNGDKNSHNILILLVNWDNPDLLDHSLPGMKETTVSSTYNSVQ